MAGDWHEAVAKLILDNPDLAWELYEVGRDRTVPVCTDPWHGAGAADADSHAPSAGAGTRAESIGAPLFSERRADRVVQFEFEGDQKLTILCEVQSAWKDQKAARLPGYVARLFEDYGAPVELVMICKSDALAARYRKGLWLGAHSVFTPIAVSPQDLGAINDPETTGRSPQMFVLTMLMRQLPNDKEEMAKAMVELRSRLGALDGERASEYAYYLTKIKGEDFMTVMDETEVFGAQPDWWLRAKARMLGEGRQDALDEGREVGRAEGRAEGRANERAESLARQRATLFSLMNRLSIKAEYDAIARIEACTDPDKLAVWTEKVVGVRSSEELFTED